jgi:hypothetical protein
VSSQDYSASGGNIYDMQGYKQERLDLVFQHHCT